MVLSVVWIISFVKVVNFGKQIKWKGRNMWLLGRTEEIYQHWGLTVDIGKVDKSKKFWKALQKACFVT